ncbi:GNAT family N-acetyltransferase [Massilia niabensis]|uniref:GNAT family N-acetyltransferase n=1 Tax=Massilia niabensis TaxID=544910 RepID=A0ABW0L4P2_9BURK
MHNLADAGAPGQADLVDYLQAWQCRVTIDVSGYARLTMLRMAVKAIALDSGSGISIIPVAVEHAAKLAALVERNLDHLGRYLPLVASLSAPEAARAHLEAAVAGADKGEVLEWHLFSGGALWGAIRVKNIDPDDRKAEIGYFIGSECAGKGIASCAVRAVLAYCFGSLQLNRMELRCASTNERSIRVAERLGFTREGMLRQAERLNGVFIDQLVYGLLRAEFLHQAAGARHCA